MVNFFQRNFQIGTRLGGCFFPRQRSGERVPLRQRLLLIYRLSYLYRRLMTVFILHFILFLYKFKSYAVKTAIDNDGVKDAIIYDYHAYKIYMKLLM